jgi:ADP-heptose:LPS heptosyltransferase
MYDVLNVPSKEEFWKDYDRETTMRVLVVRKGAIGDVLMTTPIPRILSKAYGEEGSKIVVDFYGREHSNEILQNNPHIDKVYTYPVELTGEEIAHLAKQEGDLFSLYDGVISLAMTIEGRYLFRTDGRYGIRALKADPEAGWGQSPTRRNNAKDINYMDATLRAAGLEFAAELNPELYLSDSERQYLENFKKEYENKFIIFWQPMGSTGNKMVVPMMGYIKHVLDNCPDSENFIIGDTRLKKSPDIDEYKNLHFTPGDWTLRQVLVSTRAADLVLGPESMLIMAAAAWDPMGRNKDGTRFAIEGTDQLENPVGKAVLFSHSAPTNISKYFLNADEFLPSIPCSPCYYIPVNHYHRECIDATIPNQQIFKCVKTLPHEEIKDRIIERYKEWELTQNEEKSIISEEI